MAMLSVIGCIALAFSVIGIVAFGVVVRNVPIRREFSWGDMRVKEFKGL